MALAIDSSSPAFASQNTNGASLTTASFTPPADSQLWAGSSTNGDGTGVTFTVTSTPALTWTQRIVTNAQQAPAAWHWANVAVSQSYTVTTTRSAGASQGTSCLVQVITGQETTPAGATATANSNSGRPTVNITTTQDGSLILADSGDWTQSGLATVDANQTILAEHNHAGAYTSHFWRYNGLPVTGTYTVDLETPTAQDYCLSVVEVRDSGAPPPPPLVLAPTVAMPKGRMGG